MIPVKLVFVDDDPDDRDLIRDNLTALGADGFLVLDSGATLFHFLGPLKVLPEVIVLDLNMPQMNGLQILKYLKTIEAYQTIPVYILTTSSRPEVRQQCITEGAAAYFTKPNSITELKVLLNEIYQTV